VFHCGTTEPDDHAHHQGDPDRVYRGLKKRAEAQRRSLNREVILCLERSVELEPFDSEEWLAKADRASEAGAARPDRRPASRGEASRASVVVTPTSSRTCSAAASTRTSPEVFLRDHEWSAPILWRSESPTSLRGRWWRGDLRRAGGGDPPARGRAPDGRHSPCRRSASCSSSRRRPCSAYDCEFVALAQYLKTSLVTSDRDVLRAFPQIALSPDRFLEVAT
jgi:hypothetical protein